MEYLNEKPVCIVEKRFLSACKEAMSDIFTIFPVSSSAELWKHSEQKSISLIVSSKNLLGEKPFGLLKGLAALHSSAVLLFLSQNENADYLIPMVNSVNRIRIVTNAQYDAGLRRAGADAFSLFLESRRKDKLIEELTSENEQYEFMLRQSLLS